MTTRYEYKVIKSSTKWFGMAADRRATEAYLNHLAQEGWELDQATINWSGSTDLILRRSR
ncbi:DUF4177 domain-containing protein [Haladaptatus pallidirubidus]|uniref:DUF4177 domain-containing protein n=1 Tax=Haladaptatus pallidirubidus TaxID=1008152 RepID=UPI001D118394|nr:DUF4177 domain-containing protein [Haladaptatus pallidirubidus]